MRRLLYPVSSNRRQRVHHGQKPGHTSSPGGPCSFNNASRVIDLPIGDLFTREVAADERRAARGLPAPENPFQLPRSQCLPPRRSLPRVCQKPPSPAKPKCQFRRSVHPAVRVCLTEAGARPARNELSGRGRCRRTSGSSMASTARTSMRVIAAHFCLPTVPAEGTSRGGVAARARQGPLTIYPKIRPWHPRWVPPPADSAKLRTPSVPSFHVRREKESQQRGQRMFKLSRLGPLKIQ